MALDSPLLGPPAETEIINSAPDKNSFNLSTDEIKGMENPSCNTSSSVLSIIAPGSVFLYNSWVINWHLLHTVIFSATPYVPRLLFKEI